MSWLIRAMAVFFSVFSSLQDFQNLRLHRHIQRGGRLVGDQQVGPVMVAIAIITRWRMPPDNSWGYCVMRPGAFGNADIIEHLAARASALRRAAFLVQGQGLGNLVADGHVRRQRGQRVLEDHGDLASRAGC